jgi:hypothetical protein
MAKLKIKKKKRKKSSFYKEKRLIVLTLGCIDYRSCFYLGTKDDFSSMDDRGVFVALEPSEVVLSKECRRFRFVKLAIGSGSYSEIKFNL